MTTKVVQEVWRRMLPRRRLRQLLIWVIRKFFFVWFVYLYRREIWLLYSWIKFGWYIEGWDGRNDYGWIVLVGSSCLRFVHMIWCGLDFMNPPGPLHVALSPLVYIFMDHTYILYTIIPTLIIHIHPSFSSHSKKQNSDVCTKYQEASKIVNLALTGLISQCIPGAQILDLCNFGTTIINTQAMKLYQKKVNGVAVERGVAFPVCVSVNDVICNHSPLGSEEVVSFFFFFEIYRRCLLGFCFVRMFL